MAILMTDENEINGRGMVIGEVEFLPTLPETLKNNVPTIRQISRAALEKHRKLTDGKALILSSPPPNVETFALCEICANLPRLGHSTMCAGCISDRKNEIHGNSAERQIIVRDFLLMVLLIGLLIFAVVKFAAPEASRSEKPQPVRRDAGFTTARKN